MIYEMKNKTKKKLNNKGFSLIELLAVVSILGILSVLSVVAVRSILTRMRNNYYKTQEDNILMAGTSYFDANSSIKPKSSGQAIKVSLDDLIKNKYIDPVVDYRKKTCDTSIDKSYVQVFKYEDKYYYSVILNCSNDGYTTDASVKYTDLNIDITLQEDLKDAKAKVKITDKQVGSNDYGIVSYQYRIYKNGKLFYTSETINGKKKDEINKTISLKKYVPADSVKITVTATDVYGISKTVSSQGTFKDETNPTCSQKVNLTDNDWTNVPRNIEIHCQDIGLGCTQEYSNLTFPNETSDKNYIDVASVSVRDKAGNKGKCTVNVKYDKRTPKVTITAYKRGNDDKKTGNAIGSITVGDEAKTNSTGTLDLTGISSATNNWLNKEKYPNGVYYEVTYTDKSGVSSIVWNWNTGDNNNNDSTYKNLNGGSSVKAINNAKDGSTYFTLSGDGKRYGELVVKDMTAKNSSVTPNTTTIKIITWIDKTAPDKPNVSMCEYTDNVPSSCTSSNYSGGWTSNKVYTYASGSDSMSGVSHYLFNASGAVNETNKVTQSYIIDVDGSTNFSYEVCDRAGNCSNASDSKTVNTDSTPPTLKITAYKRDSNGNATGNALKSVTTTTSSALNFDGWLNNDYPYGIYYKVEANDAQGLTKWRWAYNNSNLRLDDANVNNMIADNSYGLDDKSTVQSVRFSENGARRSIVSVTDKAGNVATITLAANLDNGAPTPPAGSAGWKDGSNSYVSASAWGSADSISGVREYLYCIKANDWNGPGNYDGCFTSNTVYYRSCGVTHYVWAVAVDNAGNRSGVSYLGYISDNADYWNWGGCSAECGGGTRYATNSCELITWQKSESCNTDACAPAVPTNNCNIRGSRKVRSTWTWTCTHGVRQTTGYIHYCSDSNGNLIVKNSETYNLSNLTGLTMNSSINTFSYVCPDRPYGAESGWTIIND